MRALALLVSIGIVVVYSQVSASVEELKPVNGFMSNKRLEPSVKRFFAYE
jgi:hypothetical protein